MAGHDLRKRFGHLVNAHRKRKSMTQEALATASGLSPDMIGRIETGQTGARFPSIERLASALEIDPAELFTADLPDGVRDRPNLAALTARLSRLNEREIGWVSGLLDAALKPRV